MLNTVSKSRRNSRKVRFFVESGRTVQAFHDFENLNITLTQLRRSSAKARIFEFDAVLASLAPFWRLAQRCLEIASQ